jgi:hypothetical protein
MDEFSDMLSSPVVASILHEKNQSAAIFKTFQDTQKGAVFSEHAYVNG